MWRKVLALTLKLFHCTANVEVLWSIINQTPLTGKHSFQLEPKATLNIVNIGLGKALFFYVSLIAMVPSKWTIQQFESSRMTSKIRNAQSAQTISFEWALLFVSGLVLLIIERTSAFVRFLFLWSRLLNVLTTRFK